jgi:hypothetical protein
MLDRQVLIIEKRPACIGYFYHKRWYNVKYGLGVFKESIVIDDDFHEERCNQLLTQMNGCSVLFSHNMWFKVEEIKEQGLQQYLINRKKSQVQS